jgi:uncharacterized PurR-regulated membrane protein YhhQ (DUF165 family)
MNFLIFGVIPVLTVTIIFIVKRKILWTAPFISIALAFITYTIAFAPISIVEIFSNNEWRGFFLLAILMHLGITIILTMIAYFVVYLTKQKQK